MVIFGRADRTAATSGWAATGGALLKPSGAFDATIPALHQTWTLLAVTLPPVDAMPSNHPPVAERASDESWIDESTSREEYQRRLAIFWLIFWLTTRRMFTHEVASMLRVGRSTVWTWLHAYNQHGPAGIAARDRGGRRDAFFTLDEECALLASLEAQAARGEFVVAAQLRGAVERAVGHAVSWAYVGRLLHRHRWRKVAPRPRHPRADPAMQATFRESFPETLAAIAPEVPPGKRLRVLFEDEASFGRITEVRRCWAPPGVRPTAPRQQIREYRQVLAAVSPRTASSVGCWLRAWMRSR
jgi:transposase